MALNFPDSPTLNQVYTDTTSGFSYQWDGVVWQSYSDASSSNIRIIDNISGSFDGIQDIFALAVSGSSITPVSPQQLRVVLGGVVQEPGVDYTVSGSNITFTTPPTGGLDCSIVSLGPAIPLGAIADGSVTPPKLSTGGPTWNTSGDVYISGIATITNDLGSVKVGVGTTTLIVEGDARVTGILTVGTSSITLDGNTNNVRVGSAVTVNSTGINVVGVVTATTFVGNEFIGVGDKLIFSPTITSFSPTDGANGVNALSSQSISITYNQPVSIGTTGTITLRTDSAGGTIVESFDVGVSTRATLNNQTLTINPTNNFDYDQEYYVVLPQGTVTNYVDGNSALLDTYNFTTESGPVVTSVQPSFGSTSVGLSTNIVFTFDKNIRAGVGTITLRTVSAGGTITESYDVDSSDRLTFNTNTLTIDPTSDLNDGTTYFVVVPNNAVAGYAGTDTYSFTTIDFSFISIDPTNGATNVGVDTNVTLTFTSPPTRGTGTIELRSGSTSGSILESFDASTSPRISVVGNSWILDPTSNLSFDASIHTIIPSTAIEKYVGLNTTGADSHSFTTIPPSLGDAYEGGYLICQAGGTRWIVAPSSSEVSRSYYAQADSNTSAQQVSGCTGWFVPNCGQLQNPGYTCRTYWDSYKSTCYWSSTFIPANPNSTNARSVNFSSGALVSLNMNTTLCIRSFRCVTY